MYIGAVQQTLLALAILHLPLNGTGRDIPALFARWSSSADRYPAWQVSVEGSYLEAYRSRPASEAWLLRYGLWTDVLGADNARYFYRAGKLLREESFDSTFLGAKAGLWRKADPGGLEIGISATAGRKWSTRRGETSPNFILPQDHWEAWTDLELSLDRSQAGLSQQLRKGFQARHILRTAVRSSWRTWGFPARPHPADRKLFFRQLLDVSHGTVWREHHNLVLRSRFVQGFSLDPLSAFSVGSSIPGSDFIVLPGYYFSEFRSNLAWSASASYGLKLHERLRLESSFHAAYLTELGFPLLTGLGLKATLKTYREIPLFLAYGYAPTAQRGSLRGGHELTLATGFAF